MLHELGLGCIGAGCVGGGQEREVWDLSKLRLSGKEGNFVCVVSLLFMLPKNEIFFFRKSKAKIDGYPF